MVTKSGLKASRNIMLAKGALLDSIHRVIIVVGLGNSRKYGRELSLLDGVSLAVNNEWQVDSILLHDHDLNVSELRMCLCLDMRMIPVFL